MRAVASVKGRDVITTDIVCEQNPTRTWIPRRRDVLVVHPNKGEFLFAIHAHALKAIIGEPIAPAEFELSALLVGTPISDNRSSRIFERRFEGEPLQERPQALIRPLLARYSPFRRALHVLDVLVERAGDEFVRRR
jgi:hypothetical protein